MKRILIRKPGGHEALQLIEEKNPEPGKGEVRVKTRAAGVNYADCMVRMGYYSAAKGLYPITPGFEFAGDVDAVDKGVKGVREGDKVFGITRFGGYAGAVLAEPKRLWPCPEGWDYADCAGFPAVFLTAYYGLQRVARIEKGETVLIHSAAGGAGSAFLQLARIAGCRTVAVVGAPHKAGWVRELGADVVITRSESDLWKEAGRAAPAGYDAVFDANGVSTLRAGFDHLAPGGRLVVYGFAEMMPRGKDRPGLAGLAWNYLRLPRFGPMEMVTTNRSVAGFNVVYLFDKTEIAARGMSRMLEWVKEGRIRKAPVAMFPMERAADAHGALESGTTKGKIVLTM